MDDRESSNQLPKRLKTSHLDEPRPLQHEDFKIAWICALHIEMAAARAMLDGVYEPLDARDGDTNTYVLGRIKNHGVVIACLPTAQYGIVNAANVVTNMKRTYPRIRVGLMVGIGGAVPSKADIRLGDVVGVRVMQYDLGKFIAGEQFIRTCFPRIPQQQLGTAVSSLRSKHELEPNRVASTINQKLARVAAYGRPVAPDRLFYATYERPSQDATCDECDASKQVPRSNRSSGEIMIHYGAIASGSAVMKNGMIRDSVARELDVICFEMEAAGRDSQGRIPAGWTESGDQT